MPTQEKFSETFKDHKLQVITNTKDVQFFRCQKEGTWSYGFQVVTIKGMIALMGDMGELVINPGSGRGLGWLRSSIHSTSYVVEKISQDIIKTKYDHEKAIGIVKDRLYDTEEDDLESEYNKKVKEIIEQMESEDIHSSETFYYAWSAADLDDPPQIEVLHYQIRWQLAALQWLVAELDDVDFVIAGEEKTCEEN